MAARITVYCRKSLNGVTPEQLLAGVKRADFLTIAEDYDIEYEIARAAQKQLRIENLDGTDFKTFVLYYGGNARHQCRIERWTDGGEVQMVINEHLERVTTRGHQALSKIQQHGSQTIEIVFVQFGSSPGVEMGPVIASEIARWVAEIGDGIIEGADDTWWELGPWKEYKELLS